MQSSHRWEKSTIDIEYRNTLTRAKRLCKSLEMGCKPTDASEAPDTRRVTADQ